ncbi:MAG: hypothetical protein GF398_10920 [Chitinivibrionales bacterium]|nr:hypothetical protein [Chitinivibrionales bacterium]
MTSSLFGSFMLNAGAICILTQTAASAPVHELGAGIIGTGAGRNATAYTGSHSAVYYNPGLLAFDKQREVSAGLTYLARRNDIEVNGRDSDDQIMRLIFSPAGIVLPVPVERGGLTFSFTYSKPFIFDDIFTYANTTTNAGGDRLFTDRDYSTFGNLDFWTAGAALQVAPGVGVGISLSLITGMQDTRFRFYRTINGQVTDSLSQDFEDHYERSYSGIDFRAGILYRPVKRLRLGLRFGPPRYVHFDETVSSYIPNKQGRLAFRYDTSGALYSSIEGALGAAYAFDFLTLSIDVRGRLPHQIVRPNDDIPESSAASQAQGGGGVALEAPLGFEALKGRLGYAYDEYDTHRFVEQYDDDDTPDWQASASNVDTDIQTFAAGFSFDRGNFGVDGAYEVRFWDLTTSEIVNELHTMQQAALGLRWRF